MFKMSSDKCLFVFLFFKYITHLVDDKVRASKNIIIVYVFVYAYISNTSISIQIVRNVDNVKIVW